jgi:hypothetical protein
MIYVLNNLPTEYDLHLALSEKRIGDKGKPLTVEEMRAELSLRFEKLKMKSSKNEENEELEENALFSCQCKGKCRNCGWIGRKLFQSKKFSSHNGGDNDSMIGGNCCFANRDKSGRTASNGRRRKKADLAII